MTPEQIAERLTAEQYIDTFVARGEVTTVVDARDLLETLRWLRDDEGLSMDALDDVTATDWPGRDPRFWVVYHLHSTTHRHRLRVKVGAAGEEPTVPSATGVYPTAGWLEREVFDLMGVGFDGHPNLVRILMPDDWEGHPQRKDAGLGGVKTSYKGAFIPPVDERIGEA